jgi:tetratricopeptide (TPR) repeat protein
MKVKQWLYAGLGAAAVAAAAVYALRLSQPRVITVRVYSDYAFRLQHSNWPDLLESRFRDANLIFQQSGTGVRWKVVGSNDTDPTSNLAGIDSRRAVLPDQGDSKADVLVSFTGMHEGPRTGSTSPFSRGVIVVDFPDRTESANLIILAENLAHIFAAPIDAAWLQSASALAPQSVRFPPRIVTLIHQLRGYHFAAGVDGLLEGSWGQRAVDAIAQADSAPNSNHAARAQQMVGIALLNERRRDDAVVHLREAARLDPKSAAIRVETALALSRNGQDADALAELAEAVRLEPNNAILHQSFGSLLVKMRRSEEAIEELNIAARLDPKNINTQLALATAFSQQLGRFDAVDAALHEALRLDPQSAAAARDLEQLAANKQALADEIARQRPRIQRAPDDSDAHYRLGDAIARTGDFQTGLRELRKSIELRPSYGPAHAESAAVYYQLGDYAAAWREVKQARDLGTEPPSGLVASLTHKMPQPQ